MKRGDGREVSRCELSFNFRLKVRGTIWVSWTAPAKPGQTLIAWGTGLGANPADSDSIQTSSPHPIDGTVDVYVGSAKVRDVVYSGASIYPGVHVIGFKIPDDAPTGCFVPIAVVTGTNVVSNTPVLPISSGTGPCADSMAGWNGEQLAKIANGSGKIGVLSVVQAVGPDRSGNPVTTAYLSAVFQRSAITHAIVNPSALGCVINGSTLNLASAPPNGLKASAVITTLPNGNGTALTSPVPGLYYAIYTGTTLPNGSYTFSAASAGADLGSFSATVSFPALSIEWTNQSDATTIDRAQGLQIKWTSAPPGSFVVINGNSGVNFTCLARAEDGGFTVPPYVLSGLKSGSGTLAVSNTTAYGSFNASGLDAGFTIGIVSTSINSSYK